MFVEMTYYEQYHYCVENKLLYNNYCNTFFINQNFPGTIAHTLKKMLHQYTPIILDTMVNKQ